MLTPSIAWNKGRLLGQKPATEAKGDLVYPDSFAVG
jgi:hypothetical protein